MEDMGRYGCTAGNSGGFQREEIYLQVQSEYNYQYVANLCRISLQSDSICK